MSNILHSDKEHIQQVAQTIYDQLGGKKFSLITGSKNYRTIKDKAIGTGITFTTPPEPPNMISRVKIYLTPLDTYTMEFYKGEILFSHKSMVYVENMLDLFETMTSLYATLSPRT